MAVACSALKASYRQLLAGERDGVRFVYLRGDADLIARRLASRDGHFMPPELLANQLETLEEPEDATWVIDVSDTPEAIGARIREKLADL